MITKHRPIALSIAMAITQNLHRGQSPLRGFLMNAGDSVRHAICEIRLRVTISRAPDLRRQQRAAPALAMLLAMVLFVIQEIVTAIRR